MRKHFQPRYRKNHRSFQQSDSTIQGRELRAPQCLSPRLRNRSSAAREIARSKLAKPLRVTLHARTRLRQRGLPRGSAEILSKHGKRIWTYGGCSVSWLPRKTARAPEFSSPVWEPFSGIGVVTQNDTIVTVMHFKSPKRACPVARRFKDRTRRRRHPRNRSLLYSKGCKR